MATYLFTWSIRHPHWWNDLYDEFGGRGHRSGNWSTGRTKRIVPRDRFFLMRLGGEPRGICASGVATSSVYPASHWDKHRARRGDRALYVDIKFETIRNPGREPILSIPELKKLPFGGRHFRWEPQASGQEIPAALARALEQRWKRFLRRPFYPKAIADPAVIEGTKTEIIVYRSGRSRRLRDQALEKAKGVCSACAVDFGKLLDGRGVRVLQVHHRKQLAGTDKPKLSRLSDLAVICANCHALVHMNPKQALSVSKLRRLLAVSRKHRASRP